MKYFIVLVVTAVLTSQLVLTTLCCKMSERGLDAKMKAEILDLHNKYRQKVANGRENGQPPASNMKELHWDDEIAAHAQRAAEMCKFKHSPTDQRATSKYRYALENAYTGNYHNPLQGAVDGWYSEVKHVTPSIVHKYHDPGTPVIGHYTQLVWAKTEAVGCGYTKSADNGWSYVFCQYAPPGNIAGRPVYEQGPAASACKNGKSSRYSGLCK